MQKSSIPYSLGDTHFNNPYTLSLYSLSDHAKEYDKKDILYIPLANPFSGDGYGMQFLPRVNSEVIVSFINGDIDRPLIIGALHNAENHHPYNLPKEKTKSFIKTQTTPQYKDQEGYNELLFEDKQGEEELNLRAQRDYNLKVLNNATSHIDNNAINIIDNDMQLTVANNATTSIGNDQRNNIAGNQITTIEKEQLLSVGADQENHLLKNVTTIINQTSKTIIEQDLLERIKGKVNHYVEKDSQAKYLANLFMQIEKDLGIQINNAYHLQAKSIKQQSPTIELQATDGISLKCGGNVLTVDSSGIHIKTANYDSNATNGGISATEVQLTDLAKPLYTKLRVVNLEATISKQETIEQLLTYRATVEKFENDAWTQTTDLTPTQKAQLQWFFIKNNDENDKDIITDNPTEDTIVIKDLEISVTLNPNNIHRYAHVHCFVADPDAENGYVMSELKRALDVTQIRGKNVLDPHATQASYRVELNIDTPTQEEIQTLIAQIEEKDTTGKITTIDTKLKEDLTIQHTLQEKKEDEAKVVELKVKVYPKDTAQNYAQTISYMRAFNQEDEMVNARGDDTNGEYINEIKNGVYHIKADTSLKEGTTVTTILHVKDKTENIIKSIERETSVEDAKVSEEFDIEQVIKDESLDRKEIGAFEGEIQWEN